MKNAFLDEKKLSTSSHMLKYCNNIKSSIPSLKQRNRKVLKINYSILFDGIIFYCFPFFALVFVDFSKIGKSLTKTAMHLKFLSKCSFI